MKLCFDSIAEVREFVASLKGTRGGKKGEGDDATDTAANALNVGSTAPAPMMPPQGGAAGAGAMPSFQPQTQPNFAPPQQQPSFPGAGGIDPNVMNIVQRINARIDGAINNGQPADTVLGWFRGECSKGGVDATSATLDQIKQALLPRLPMQHLEAIAKLMNA